MSADNQQERSLITENQKWFLAGFIEGEGSVNVSIKKHPTAKFGYIIDPEFNIYQYKEREEILYFAKEMFKTGRIYPKPGNEEVLVFRIESRRTLLEKVIPFFNKYMLYSTRKEDIIKFEKIVRDLENKKHWTKEGLIEIINLAYSMNMNGKQRKKEKEEIINEILRG